MPFSTIMEADKNKTTRSVTERKFTINSFSCCCIIWVSEKFVMRIFV